jgi:hypothetical protein
MTYETGLSWLAEQCEEISGLLPAEMDCLIERGPVSAMTLITARSVTELGRPASLQLGRDVRRLLDSRLADETIRTVWVGSTDQAFDPAKERVTARAWLERTESAWLAAESRSEPGFVPPAARPVTDEVLRAAALRAMAPVASALARAYGEGEVFNPLPLPGLIPALEQLISTVCADLGFRLFLRAVMYYRLPVSEACHASLVTLGARFGYPDQLVKQGLQRY